MPTDPYVPERLEDAPRQEPNLAPGVKIPPARPWRADRPGDLPAGQPHGTLLGSPGPNVGYALTLARRARDRLTLGPHEHADDALAVVGEIAMKRAAALGRAPVMSDVETAMTLLGYTGEAPVDFAEWRARAVHGAHHDYQARRALVDAASPDVLRLRADKLGDHVAEFRERLRAAMEVPVAT
jgi:hypothetical protein